MSTMLLWCSYEEQEFVDLVGLQLGASFYIIFMTRRYAYVLSLIPSLPASLGLL